MAAQHTVVTQYPLLTLPHSVAEVAAAAEV
jgi:hypothetical protein